MTDHTTSIDGLFWRMLFTDHAENITAPARAPEGRWHYNGQPALYLSATPEGCAIATARYVGDGDPSRAIYPLRVRSSAIVDLRDPTAAAHFGIYLTHRTTEWQLDRARGLPAPTWAISDRVRALNLDGMLYPSRKEPGKTHLTLFRWNTPGHAVVTPGGTPIPFDPAGPSAVASAPQPKKSDG